MIGRIALLIKLLRTRPLIFIFYFIQSPFKKKIKFFYKNQWVYYNNDKSTLKHLVKSLGKIEKMVDYLPDNIDGAIIDGGANNGIFSILLSQKVNNKIYAFEPSLRLLGILKLNQQNKNIEVISKALSSDTGILKFYISKDSDQIGSTIPENVEAFDKSKNIESFIVDSISLNDFINMYSIEKIGVLKLDIQGGEYDVLKKNEKILDITDILVIECMFIEETVFDLIELVRKSFPQYRVINPVAYGADMIFYKNHIKLEV